MKEKISYIQDVFMDIYDKQLVDLLLRSTNVLSLLPHKDFTGKSHVYTVRRRGNFGSGFRKERITLPEAQAREYKQSSLSTYYFYQALDLTLPEIRESKGPGALIDVLGDAVDDAHDNALHNGNRVSIGDGSARMGTISSIDSSDGTYTTLTVADFPIEIFQIGMVLTAGTGSTGYRVEGVDNSTAQIKVTNDSTGADASGDGQWTGTNNIYWYGGYDAGFDTEPPGLMAVISDSNPPSGTFQGKDRTATGNEWLKAYVQGTAGDNTLLSYLVMKQFLDNLRAHSGKKTKVNSLLAETGVYNSWMLVLENKGITTQPVVSEGGFASDLSFVFGGKRYVFREIDEMLDGELYALDTQGGIEIRESFPLQWETYGSGGKFVRSVTEDIITARMAWYFTIGSKDPRRNGVFKGIKRNAIS